MSTSSFAHPRHGLAGAAVRFADNIKRLVRRPDRQSMQLAFDLSSCDDVSHHADAILGRLRSGDDALRRCVA